MKKEYLYGGGGALILIVIIITGVMLFGDKVDESAAVQVASQIPMQQDAVSPEIKPIKVTEGCSFYSNSMIQATGFYTTCACSDGRIKGTDGSCYYKCSGVDSWSGVPNQIAPGGTFPQADSTKTNGIGCYTCSSSYGTWGDDCKWHCCSSGYGYFYDGLCHKSPPQTNTCTDSDGGKEYYTKGTTTSTSQGTFTDFCDGEYNGNPAVKEYFCQACSSGDGDCVWSVRASQGGYVCNDGKLVKQDTCTGPTCPPASDVTCGQSIQPNPGCTGPCQGYGTKCSSGKTCQNGICVGENTCSLTNPSLCQHVGQRCMDSTHLCSDAFVYNNNYYCEAGKEGVCQNGCQNNACVANQCTSGQTECKDSDEKRECVEGRWSDPVLCPADKPDCESGSCISNPCTGVTCLNTCDGNTLKFGGWCDKTKTPVCQYQEMVCEDGCTDGACGGGTECPTGCPDQCAANTKYFNGQCVSAQCQYQQENCVDGCELVNGAARCKGQNICVGNTCTEKCEVDVHYYDGQCNPQTGQCVYKSEKCDDGCDGTVCKGQEGFCDANTGVCVGGIFGVILLLFGAGFWYVMKKM